ncbi:MAG: MlaD family protein [Campylobacter sp.]|nr:MlaD family protein [Campylobacter sp.]
MENRNSYTIVGLFFIICVALLAIFLWWMDSANPSKMGKKAYYIHTSELPSGVNVDANVKFIGINVGSVSKIDFIENNMIEITLKIRDDIDIKEDSVAEIDLHPISGIASINITKGTEISRSISFDEHPLIPLEESIISKLKDQANEFGEKISSVLDSINTLLSSENTTNLTQTLKHIQNFAGSLASDENSKNFNELLRNLNNFSAGLEKIDKKEIAKLSKNANLLLENTNKMVVNLNKSVNGFGALSKSLQAKIDSGEYDIKNSIAPLLNEANNAVESFSKTLREFRAAMNRLEDNPYEFFFKDTSGE